MNNIQSVNTSAQQTTFCAKRTYEMMSKLAGNFDNLGTKEIPIVWAKDKNIIINVADYIYSKLAKLDLTTQGNKIRNILGKKSKGKQTLQEFCNKHDCHQGNYGKDIDGSDVHWLDTILNSIALKSYFFDKKGNFIRACKQYQDGKSIIIDGKGTHYILMPINNGQQYKPDIKKFNNFREVLQYYREYMTKLINN